MFTGYLPFTGDLLKLTLPCAGFGRATQVTIKDLLYLNIHKFNIT